MLKAATKLLKSLPHRTLQSAGEPDRGKYAKTAEHTAVESVQALHHSGLPRVAGRAHRRRQDVAVDVAAGAERGAHGLDDAGEDGLQVVLEHAVELVALPRGQPQRPLPVLPQRGTQH